MLHNYLILPKLGHFMKIIKERLRFKNLSFPDINFLHAEGLVDAL
jgi:hypothetical protein